MTGVKTAQKPHAPSAKGSGAAEIAVKDLNGKIEQHGSVVSFWPQHSNPSIYIFIQIEALS